MMTMRKDHERPTPLVRHAGSALLSALLLLAPLGCQRDSRPPSGRADSGAEDAVSPADDAGRIAVARIGKYTITPDDVRAKMEVQYPQLKDLRGPEAVHQMWEILLLMQDQYLWVDLGERRGLDKDEDFRRQLEVSRKFILSSFTIRRLVREAAEPTPEEVEAYYRENEDQFRTAARATVGHILVPTRGEAERLRQRALSGEDFPELARRYSRDETSAGSGGMVGFVGTGTIIRGFDAVYPELNAAIFSVPVGSVTEPLSTPRGWSIFHVIDRVPVKTTPLEEARAGIEKRMKSRRENEIYASLVEEARRESKARIDTAAWHDYASRVLTEDEFFSVAESDRRPELRVSWLRAFAERYPDSPRAPQALFLAGFAFAEELRDYRRAALYFQEMLERFPESELASSARWMLENMEKGLENLPYADQIKRRASS